MSDLGTSTGLLDLPNELIEAVLIHLHPLNIVTCRRICSSFKDIVDTSVELKLRIELAIDGLLLNEKGDFPANDLLKRMKAIRHAFETFTPPWSWRFDSANTRYDQYEICDGLWGRSTQRVRLDPFRSMGIVELVPPNVQGKRWEKHWADLGMNVTDFSFEVSSDLLILMEYQEDDNSRVIHFRTISENTPNPLAAQPCFVILKHECPVWDSCLTLVHNNHVALHFADYVREMTHVSRRGAALVYNWRTGKQVTPYMHVSDLTFLSDDAVLVLFDGANNSPVAFGICSLTTGQLTHEFELPLPHREVYRARILTHPGYGTASSATQARLVQPDPALEIIVADFVLEASRNDRFLIIISVNLFLRKFESLKKREPNILRYSWLDWGPDVTRWLPSAQLANSGFRSTFSSKMLVRSNSHMPQHDYSDSIPSMLSPENDWGPPGNIILLDFNPRPILRGAQNEDTEHCRVVVFRDRSVWRSDHHQTSAESSLPFRAFIGKRVVEYEDVHLDGSTMVCRKEGSYSIFSFLPRDESMEGTELDSEEHI